MTVAKGLKVNLFASEKEFPELAKPVQMAFDTKGRLWVAVWPTYPHWKPKEEMNDKLLILEDTDGDGKADKMTVFADDLHCPTGFEFCNGGVLVAQAPDLMFLKDTDGDDKADVRERVLTASTRPTRTTRPTASRSIRAGRSTSRKGRSTTRRSRRPTARRVRLRQRRRLPLRAADAEVRGLRHLRLRQPARPRLRPLGPGHRRRRHRRQPVPRRRCSPATSITRTSTAAPPQVYQQRTRPCPGIEILSSRHFPEEIAGQPAGRQRDRLPGHPAVQDRRQRSRASRHRGRADRLVDRSELPPVRHRRSGPDGAIYFIDWQNPIIGHMQHNLRDPSRDRDARPHLPRHLRGPAAAEAGRRSPASRSRSCSTC